jgi:hypothetical protein
MSPAVELVIKDGWLGDRDFVDCCVVRVSDVAVVDWVAVDEFVAGSAHVARLLQAQSMARQALRALDPEPHPAR